jgi:UDP-N-acetylglucosamine--N-acetylmuramyl-(pentapeptide) pyrophosphoryl-undecaprenol N-acetylglucosamine transferase
MRVLIATGASGGHIFPALALKESLERLSPSPRVLLVAPRKPLSERLLGEDQQARFIPHCPVSRIALGDPRGWLDFARVWIESARILARFKPDVVVGFGSFDSLPLVLLAWFIRAKTLVHEQNVLPGKANALLAKFADKIALSFAETKEFLPVNASRVAVTGNPLRSCLRASPRADALRFFGFQDETPHVCTILVLGGSQGSSRINMTFCEAVCGDQQKGVRIVHITGERDQERVSRMYADAGIRAKVFPFLKEMHLAYAACDFAVTRAGAMTISELIRFSLPAVLVPYPYAQEHQKANAQFLEKNGCAVIIKDDAFSVSVVRRAIADFSADPDLLGRMRAGYQHIFKPDGGDSLAAEVVGLVRPDMPQERIRSVRRTHEV